MEKVNLELTKEQYENIKTLVALGMRDLDNVNFIRETLPKSLKGEISYSIPKNPDVNFLVRRGVLNNNRNGTTEKFKKLMNKVFDEHPEVAKEYVELLFKSAKVRKFSFTSNFRKDICEIALKKNVLPDVAKLYYVRSFSSSGSNETWVKDNLNTGNLPDNTWDLLAKSKRFDVLYYVISKGPIDILPMLVANIANVKTTGYRRTKRFDVKYASGYLQFLFNERIIAEKAKKKFIPVSYYNWEYKHRYGKKY